jgi:hypothetical protein
MSNTMKRIVRTLAAVVLAAILAGCGTATQSSSATSSPSDGPVPSANAQACQDLAKQRAWVKEHEATLTVVDIAKVGAWLDTDADYSTGQLHTDMAAFAAAYQSAISTGQEPKDSATLRQRVADDCSAIGVSV